MKQRNQMLRKEVEEKFTWNLKDIFATEEKYSEEYAHTQKRIEEFAKYNGKVKENLLAVLDEYFGIALSLYRISAYAFMMLQGDNSDVKAQERYGKAHSLAVAFETATAFLSPELLLMDENELKSYLEDENFTKYQSYIKDVLHQKPYTLSPSEERLLAMVGEISAVPEQTFDTLTVNDMVFPEVLDMDGKNKVKLSESYYGKLIRSNDREVRKQAFEALFKTYDSFKNTIASIYAGNVSSDKLNAKARGHKSCLAMRMYADYLPTKVYDNLVNVVNNSIPSLDKYLELRKEKLSLDTLEMYDLYVPIMENVTMDMPYDKAYDTVCEGLEVLGKDYVEVLKRAKEERWIDVYENKAKSSGAFSYGVYGVHPYIMLNHNDNLESTMTLAHELGHTMHSYFSDKTQEFAKSSYSLFVAEVASTVNEVLLIRHLINKTEDKNIKAYLLNYFLEQFRTTVFRQTMFAEFERDAHSMSENNEVLTHEALNDLYYKLNQKYYGNSCKVDELIAREWMRIPHFYRSFYVFVYATGFSAAVYLANRILTEGQKAVDDYKKFLSAGCSVTPIEALKLAGVNMEEPYAIEEAMKVFANSIEELKSLI